MARKILIFIAMAIAAVGADAASVRGVSAASRNGKTTAATQTANPTSSYTYNYMYPYLNNQMRTTLKPADPTSPSTSPINAVVRTEQLSAPRRVVARSTKKTSATSGNTGTSPARRVVPRSNTARVAAEAYRPTNQDNHKNGITDNFLRGETSSEYSTLDGYRPTGSRDNIADRDNVVEDASGRGELTSEQRLAPNSISSPDTPTIPSARCLADYTECMDRYCARENTKYNRCYCSAKLSQIDATYQPEIDSLVKQIIAIKNGGDSWSEAEFNEYWMEKIGQYTGDNSWEKIDEFLNIDWAPMESRVRGQNAFITGHDYCVQHLRGCFYMASNLRDAYRSNINSDCSTYEASLQKLKNAAESVIEAYKE